MITLTVNVWWKNNNCYNITIYVNNAEKIFSKKSSKNHVISWLKKSTIFTNIFLIVLDNKIIIVFKIVTILKKVAK